MGLDVIGEPHVEFTVTEGHDGNDVAILVLEVPRGAFGETQPLWHRNPVSLPQLVTGTQLVAELQSQRVPRRDWVVQRYLLAVLLHCEVLVAVAFEAGLVGYPFFLRGQRTAGPEQTQHGERPEQ